MAMDPSVRIDLAAEFTGKKAFGQADTATAKLTKSAKNLARTFGASTEQFKSMTNGLAQALNGNFASLTKTGFVLDENTKSIIKNGTESERVEAIVAVLDSTYKDFNKNLRDTPVGQMAVLANAAQEASTVIGTSLLGALQSVTNSTDIEQLAEKIVQFSKTAGRAIEQLGITIHENLRTLKSLAITFAAIWTSTAIMAGIQGILKIILSLTKAYKILRATALGAAIAEAAVLNPLGAIAWGATLVATITAATIQINKLSDAFSDADGQAKKLGDTIGNYQMSTGSMLDLGAINRSVDALYVRKALAAKLKADKAAAAAKLKADKKASANLLKLKKAESVFDMQKIQIAAALKGKISEEEKTRLLLMQAIADEDATKAEKLQKKLEQIQAQNAEIAASLLAIGEATDPFAAWVTSLDAAALILGKMPALLDATGSLTGRGKVTLPTIEQSPGGSTSIYTPDMTASEIADTATAAADMAVAAAEAAVASVLASDPIVAAIVEAANAATGMTDVVTNAPIVTGSSSMFNPYGTTPGSSSGYGTQAPTIIVNNNGSVIMQDELIDVVSDAVLASQRFGYGRTPAGAIT
jgi:hypothetical protein